MSDPAGATSIDPAELARCLFDEANDALIIFDPNSLKLLDVNPLTQRLTNRKRKELLQLSISDLFASDNSTLCQQFLNSCKETTIYHSRESHQLICGEGEPLEVNVSVSRLHTSPAPLGLISVRDVSDRKSLEADLRHAKALLQASLNEQTQRLETTSEELRDTEQRMRELLDDVGAIVWEADLPDISFSFVSKHAETLLGYPVEQWLTEPGFLFNHVHEDDAATCLEECLAATKEGRDHELQYRMRSASGQDVWFRDLVHVVKDTDGTPIQLRGILIDVTQQVLAEQEQLRLARELRKSEQKLSHVARLSTMGEMVAGIAHELNQPLSAISNFANAAMAALKTKTGTSTDPVERWIEQIDEQAARCGDIIRRLRGFTRKNDAKSTRVNVHEAVNTALAILSDRLKEVEADVVTDVSSEAYVVANDVEVQQVLVNLIRNACDAMEDTTSVARIHVRAKVNSDSLELTIEDNGPGVPPDCHDSIFDPFYTTRADGMGIGLAISQSIVANHGGRLLLDRTCTSGARFCLQLPLAQQAPEGEGTDDDSVVFLVDDDDGSAGSIIALMDCIGVKTRRFSSAEEFLAEYSGGRDMPECACLILDVRLPGMSGPDLCKTLAALGQSLPTIMISGHLDIDKNKIPGVIAGLQKPFRGAELWGHVNSVFQR